MRPFIARVAGHTPSVVALYRNSSPSFATTASVAGNLHGAWRGGGLSLPGRWSHSKRRRSWWTLSLWACQQREALCRFQGIISREWFRLGAGRVIDLPLWTLTKGSFMAAVGLNGLIGI